MSNVLATTSIVAKTSLALIKNNCIFATRVNRKYEDEFVGNQNRGYSPGQTINIKKPPRYTYRSGRVALAQDTVENTIPLTLQQGGCDISFNGVERTLSLQELSKKIKAAIVPVVNEIDRVGLDLARTSVYNTINSAGALPTTQALALAAFTGLNQRLDEMSAPRDDMRSLICNPAFYGSVIGGMAGMFNPADTLSEQYKRGTMKNALGLTVDMDQNVGVQVNGAATVTNIAAGSSGSTINCVAVATGTLAAGTVVTLPGVYAVNPVSKVQSSNLANFVVTADAAAGATSFTVSPALVLSGPFQNVSAAPTVGSPYVILGSASTRYNTNIAFHEDAFTLASVPLWQPAGGKGVVSAAQESDSGFTVSVIETFDAINYVSLMRIDVLFGWAATYPELACKYYTI